MSVSDSEPTSATPWETPVPEEEKPLVAAVAAHPMLDSVGALAHLLAQLPPEMSLWLDGHAREDPDNRPRQQFLAVTPRIVGVTSPAGTERSMEPGLELGTVYVPFDSDPGSQAAAAVRRDLLPECAYARAEERMEQGAVPGALGDIASVLEDVGGLLRAAAEWLDRASSDAQNLHVEASRISQAAERVAQMAKSIKDTDCG
ncbi:hypothetical protein [Kitasatospora sp. NPDC059160]|uniref:hypothetical protein n=1 Tax=Kitasatospora sp. NPDC059160 TaxID=3346748 RepID=UPI00369EF167